jgi:hypothetical protein
MQKPTPRELEVRALVREHDRSGLSWAAIAEREGMALSRVLAHILVCFLAYAMWKTLSEWQKRARLGSSPRTIVEELARIQTVDVVLPLENGRDMRLRCVVKPEPETQSLIDRRGLSLPQRLKAPEHYPRM